MGSSTFTTRATGKTAKEAFDNAVEHAAHQYGHGGYTGTIAEKRDFVMIKLPLGSDPEDYAYKLINDSDQRIDDKWGPAGCMKIKDGEFLFFGWASD